MNTRRLYVVLVFMSLALTGIVAIQVSLLQRALSVQESRFRWEVREALQEVASNVQARQMKAVMVRRNEEVRVTDQLKEPVLSFIPEASVVDTDSIAIRFSSTFQGEMDSLVTGYSEEKASVIWMTGPAAGLAEERQIRIQLDGDPAYVQVMTSTLQELESMEAKDLPPPDSQALASLMARIFEEKGILLAYQHEIYLSEQPLESPEANTFSHQVLLSPASSPGPQWRLLVTFPGESAFLLRSVWREAIGSLLFSAIILIGFAYTTRTIFRQKRLSEMKNDFINNMTHELKTPLATIGLATEALLHQPEEAASSRLRQYAGIIRQENKRMQGQIERVLEAARFDQKGVQPQRTRLLVEDLLKEAMAQVEAQIQWRQGQAACFIAQPGLAVWADRNQLVQVMVNLLDNALKYSPEKPDIQVNISRQQTGVEVAVLDRGIGFPGHETSRLFERFYRIPTGNLHNVKGFGLGLSYVKEVVEAHDGRVKAAPRQGGGAVFRIWLPALQEEVADSANRPDHVSPSTS